MIRWHAGHYTFLQTQLQGSKQASDCAVPNLCAAVGLRIVGLTVLRGRAVYALHLAPQDLQGLVNQGEERPLIVAFQNELNVPEPSYIGARQVNHVAVFKGSFCRDHVRKHALRGMAPNDQALDHLATFSSFIDLLVTASELITTLDAARRDVPKTDADNRYLVGSPGVATTLFA